jgi:hypothetical protein
MGSKRQNNQLELAFGAPGVDGMTVAQLTPYLKEHWLAIRAQLLDGTYRPLPVRRVEIPKPGGGKRALGIPTVLDRFIQQAVLQVLQGEWDGTFSASSYGFRPAIPARIGLALPRRPGPDPTASKSVPVYRQTKMAEFGQVLCRHLFLSARQPTARTRLGPSGRALDGGLLGFDLLRCPAPMFLVPAVRLPLRFPQRVGALLDPFLPFGIHLVLPHRSAAT